MGGSPYLGKLSKEDKKFFGELKGSKAIQQKDRIKPEKKNNDRNLPIRGQ